MRLSSSLLTCAGKDSYLRKLLTLDNAIDVSIADNILPTQAHVEVIGIINNEYISGGQIGIVNRHCLKWPVDAIFTNIVQLRLKHE